MIPAMGRTAPMPNGKIRQLKEKYIYMYRVRRSLDANGARKGFIINVTDIWRPVDLIPVFGETCSLDWTSSTSIDLAEEFLVNRFFDKTSFVDIF